MRGQMDAPVMSDTAATLVGVKVSASPARNRRSGETDAKASGPDATSQAGCSRLGRDLGATLGALRAVRDEPEADRGVQGVRVRTVAGGRSRVPASTVSRWLYRVQALSARDGFRTLLRSRDRPDFVSHLIQ
jgi:hypothetical protein